MFQVKWGVEVILQYPVLNVLKEMVLVGAMETVSGWMKNVLWKVHSSIDYYTPILFKHFMKSVILSQEFQIFVKRWKMSKKIPYINFWYLDWKYCKNYNKSWLLINLFGILLKNSNFWSSRNLWKINIFKNIFLFLP